MDLIKKNFLFDGYSSYLNVGISLRLKDCIANKISDW